MASKSPRPAALILPFLSAALLWCSFHPLNLGPLGWIALVPLLVYLQIETRGWRALLLCYLAGYVYFASSLYWMRYISDLIPFAFAIYNALQWLLFAWLVRASRVSILISAPVAWTALEFVKTILPVASFPWFFLGHTQHEAEHLIQVSDLLGATFVSMLVAAVNAAISTIVLGRANVRYGVGLAAILVACLVYGFVRVGSIEQTAGPTVAIVQPNEPQDLREIVLKTKAAPEFIYVEQDRTFNHLRDLTLTALRDKKVDLIIWPETAVLYIHYFDRKTGKYDETLYGHREVWKVAKDTESILLTGFDVEEGEEGRRGVIHNSALCWDPKAGIVGRYDKIVLVPFGEYVPFLGVFPWIKDLEKNYTGLGEFTNGEPGHDFTVFALGKWRFGTIICFEGAMPNICREIAGRGADLIVNLSNDGWFRDSAELDQMLAIAKFRSIENRVPMVRATNTGISVVIDAAGRIRDRLVVDGKDREVQGVLIAQVPLGTSWSLYRLTGEVLGVALLLIQLALLGLRVRVGRV